MRVSQTQHGGQHELLQGQDAEALQARLTEQAACRQRESVDLLRGLGAAWHKLVYVSEIGGQQVISVVVVVLVDLGNLVLW